MEMVFNLVKATGSLLPYMVLKYPPLAWLVLLTLRRSLQHVAGSLYISILKVYLQIVLLHNAHRPGVGEKWQRKDLEDEGFPVRRKAEHSTREDGL